MKQLATPQVVRFAGLTLLLLGISSAPAAAQSETVEYYGLDVLGSVRVIFNAQGGVVDRMDYGPFGENLRAAIKFPVEQFAQLARDAESGQDYAQARNYSAQAGRFSGVDSVFAGLFEPQSWNRYAYVSNNPVKLVDPDGRQFRSATQACNNPPPSSDAGTQRMSQSEHSALCSGTSGAVTIALTSSTPTGGGSGNYFIIDRNPNRTQDRRNPGNTPSRMPTTGDATTINGVTFIAGADLNLVVGLGIDANAGGLIGPSGCAAGGVAAGGFASGGPAVGLNLGASLFGGVVFGPTSNVRGEMTNLNLTFGGSLNVTIMFNNAFRFSGFTVGAGVGPPSPVMASISGTSTSTAVVGECQ